ncbi:peptidase [Solihabitans fulvus]|uniref:Peptidase n=1 Tax=Solihabitans fulvus TaxID=1892852 RepID=A0A5B2WUF4_9PSEU|nr:putative Ig domain-containing protein [Solihabitans fulvus]KAA2254504.1 peptidase [Solihabitans fulvus]
MQRRTTLAGLASLALVIGITTAQPGFIGEAATQPATPAHAPAACAGEVVGNGGFESGLTPWAQNDTIVVDNTQGEAAHGGSHLAWLDGYGSTHTDTLTQQLAIPADCTQASLSYWLHIDTKETDPNTAYDVLTVSLGGTTLATYSNKDAGNGYTQKTFDVSGQAGKTVTLTFNGVEDSSLATSFAIDDVSLTGTGGTPSGPTVTSPGNQTGTVGKAASLQISATDPGGSTLTYGATGLPTGLSVAANSGLITGTPTTAGTYSVTVTATNTSGKSGSASFTWTVNPPGGTDTTRTPYQASYAVNLTSDSTGAHWSGTENVTFANASATPLAEAYLRLWDNYHGSCPTTPITVSNVTGGTAGSLEVNCTALKVTLPTPLNQGQQATIGFNLVIDVPANSDRFGRDGAYSFIGNALPVLALKDGSGWHLDPYTNNGESFYTLASDFNVVLDHPTSVLVPATGTSTDQPGTSGRTVTTATAAKVRDFAWGAGPFAKQSTTSSTGVRVNTYAVSGVSSSSATSMLNTAAQAMDSHSAKYGAYPYGEVDVVLDNNFWFGGMEYPGFILETISNTALVHELAHQWWYGIVGDDQYNGPWLDESFADYATDVYFGDNGVGCWNNVSWAGADERITNSMAYWDQHSDRYSTVVYGYGKCALHDLAGVLGSSVMAQFLKDYAQSHWYGVSTTAEFKAAAQARTSTDLTSFWSQHRIVG